MGWPIDDDFDDGEQSPLCKQMSKIGRIGGKVTYSRYGIEHYRAVGARGGASTREKGAEYYREIGRKGGLRTAAVRRETELLKGVVVDVNV